MASSGNVFFGADESTERMLMLDCGNDEGIDILE
jgi:hypothetical protein